jgi:hypothetical protein
MLVLGVHQGKMKVRQLNLRESYDWEAKLAELAKASGMDLMEDAKDQSSEQSRK